MFKVGKHRLTITFLTRVFSGIGQVGKYLFKVSKITLDQRLDGHCSNVILLTLNRYLPLGLGVFSQNFKKLTCLKSVK